MVKNITTENNNIKLVDEEEVRDMSIFLKNLVMKILDLERLVLMLNQDLKKSNDKKGLVILSSKMDKRFQELFKELESFNKLIKNNLSDGSSYLNSYIVF